MLAPWIVTLRDTALAIAAVAGALVTLATAAKVPVVNRPVRWFWRRLVADPVGRWIEGVLDRHAEPDRAEAAEMHRRLKLVEHEVHTNDGQSLRDVADRVEVMSRELMRRTSGPDDPPPTAVPEPT